LPPKYENSNSNKSTRILIESEIIKGKLIWQQFISQTETRKRPKTEYLGFKKGNYSLAA
jgi:hypothetical protein